MSQEKKSLTADRPNPAQRAVALLGGYLQAAEKLTAHTGRRYTRHAVRKWYQCRIPHDAVIAITQLLEGTMSPYELRPDLYPDPEWMPPGVPEQASKLSYKTVLRLCAENPGITPHQLNRDIYPNPDWRLPEGFTDSNHGGT